MNDLEFRSFSKTLVEGDLILLFRNEVQPTLTANQAPLASVSSLAEKADSLGLVLSFLDRSKPLLLFMTPAGQLTLDFLADLVYSADPNKGYAYLDHFTQETSAETALRLQNFVQEISSYPFVTKSQQYEAYSQGLFGKAFPWPPLTKTSSQLDVLLTLSQKVGIAVDSFTHHSSITRLQEDRYAYTFV